MKDKWWNISKTQWSVTYNQPSGKYVLKVQWSIITNRWGRENYKSKKKKLIHKDKIGLPLCLLQLVVVSCSHEYLPKLKQKHTSLVWYFVGTTRNNELGKRKTATISNTTKINFTVQRQPKQQKQKQNY